MKKIHKQFCAIFLTGILLGSSLHPAISYAQATPDYETIKTVLMEMKGLINQMYIAVNAHEKGSGTIGGTELTYTPDQLAQLITDYNTWKGQLATKYSELP